MAKGQSGIMTLFAIGVFMGGLDNGIMSSALTTLIHSFGISTGWGAWAITIYTLGLAVSVPVMAKLSDRYGRKRLFLICIALFGLGSMSVALSQNFTALLLSRALQSLGGGGIFPIANGYIVSTVPTERQGRALGMIGGISGMTAILGPNIGSFILGITNDWHWLFWINVPIALTLVLVGAKGIAESKASSQGRLDWPGIVLLSTGMLGLMYGLTNLKGVHLLQDLRSPSVYGFVIAGLILLAILLWFENRVDRLGRDSLLPMSILRRPAQRWTLMIGLSSGLILATVIFLPAFIQIMLGWPASQAGYWYTPMALASGVGAVGGGAWMDRRGPIALLAIGAAVAGIGAALFPLWVTHTWQMVIASSLLGLGVGVTLGAPTNFLITEGVPQNKSTALGIMSLTRTIGMTLGPTVYAGFLARATTTFPTRVLQNLKAIGIAPSNIPTSEFARINSMAGLDTPTDQLQQVPDPIRQAIASALHDAGSSGFANLYWTAFAISMCALLFVLIVGKHRQKTLRLERESTSPPIPQIH